MAMLTASQIYVMDFESYEYLQIVREQFLAAGAENAIVEDLTPELEDHLHRELYPERYEEFIGENDWERDEEESLASLIFGDEYTYTDWLMGN